MAAKDTDDRKTDNADADISLDMSQAAVKRMIAEARERGGRRGARGRAAPAGAFRLRF